MELMTRLMMVSATLPCKLAWTASSSIISDLFMHPPLKKYFGVIKLLLQALRNKKIMSFIDYNAILSAETKFLISILLNTVKKKRRNNYFYCIKLNLLPLKGNKSSFSKVYPYRYPIKRKIFHHLFLQIADIWRFYPGYHIAENHKGWRNTGNLGNIIKF